MIHEIGLELQAALVVRECPFRVVDGPEPTATTTWGRERIVLEYGDDFKFGPVRSQHKNPQHAGSMTIPAKATIYAQSTRAGAMRFEHERRALLAARQVYVALEKVLRLRKNPPTIKSGRFVPPPDLEKSERPAGAVFEIEFEFLTGVPDLTWAGEARPEHTLGEGDIRSCTHVSSRGGDENETACGIC